ncbi:hypothetical protein GPA22_05765 [Aromatoleum toluvorans]|uniref:Uncharacterized protein n=1 Tax=Aromatoleum toluvorans TaxID=92002 RepID=A0ABX1PVS3_9RHOO|nr:hypothetical protein [Aromatoleum toluvorans]NMG43238.1 hypothetical protein [Aromatoleum toluvorans]
MGTQINGHGAAPSFSYLLYRYLWPFQYFRDVTRGGRLERQQAYRHNRAMRRYLPGFVAKWSFLTLLAMAAGSALEHSGLAIPAAGSFIFATWTLIVALLLAVDWFWLERFPELY